MLDQPLVSNYLNVISISLGKSVQRTPLETVGRSIGVGKGGDR